MSNYITIKELKKYIRNLPNDMIIDVNVDSVCSDYHEFPIKNMECKMKVYGYMENIHKKAVLTFIV